MPWAYVCGTTRIEKKKGKTQERERDMWGKSTAVRNETRKRSGMANGGGRGQGRRKTASRVDYSRDRTFSGRRHDRPRETAAATLLHVRTPIPRITPFPRLEKPATEREREKGVGSCRCCYPRYYETRSAKTQHERQREIARTR